ncbi:MAG: hypothetical protein U9N38_06855 [Thermodesulfobacteriota bacterium]|nr:hypothetical protein [Thermodesulfobacteriota bacterium]
MRMDTIVLYVAVAASIAVLLSFSGCIGEDDKGGSDTGSRYVETPNPTPTPTYPRVTARIENVQSEKSGLVADVGYDLYVENTGNGGTDWVVVTVEVADSTGTTLDTQTVEINRHLGPGDHVRKHLTWHRDIGDLGHQLVSIWKDSESYQFGIVISDVNYQGER